MKVLFLGTGAADYIYETHRNTQGYRRNSSVLIDDKILIDPGPCVCDAIETFKVDAAKIKYVLNTHRHSDHFNEQILDFLKANGAEFITFSDNETKNYDGYEITALAGNHSIDVQHFIVENGGKKIFYGLDSAWLMYNEVQAIKSRKIDLAVFDATIGFIDGDYRIFEHCNINMIIEMKKTLQPYIDRFFISHMARTLHDEHEVLTERMNEFGVEVAFDGMEIII